MGLPYERAPRPPRRARHSRARTGRCPTRPSARRRASDCGRRRRSSAWRASSPNAATRPTSRGAGAARGSRSGAAGVRRPADRRLGAGDRRALGASGSLLLGEAEPGRRAALRRPGRVGAHRRGRRADSGAGRRAARPREPVRSRTRPQPPQGARWVRPAARGARWRSASGRRPGSLRQPVWLGLRDDVPAPLRRSRTSIARPARGLAATAVVDGRTHRRSRTSTSRSTPTAPPSATCWSTRRRIAPVQLPHLRGRALTLLRCPDGVEGERFFEKRAPGHRPDWVATPRSPTGASDRAHRRRRSGDARLAGAARGAGAAPSLALAREPDRPTAVVFDLDPGAPATIVECCEVALLLRAMLDGVGLRAVAEDVRIQGPAGLRPAQPSRGDVRRDQGVREGGRRGAAGGTAGPRRRAAGEGAARGPGARRLVPERPREDDDRGLFARARATPTVSAPVTWDEVEATAQAGDPARWLHAERHPARVEATATCSRGRGLSQRLPARAEAAARTHVEGRAGPAGLVLGSRPHQVLG